MFRHVSKSFHLPLVKSPCQPVTDPQRICRSLHQSCTATHEIISPPASRPASAKPTPSPKSQSLYVDTAPPTPVQLAAAAYFFSTHSTSKLWTGGEWRQRTEPQTSPDPTSLQAAVPEIVVLGRSNTGKSSLLNALCDEEDLCRVGPRPGKTQTMRAWALSPTRDFVKKQQRRHPSSVVDTVPRLAILDMPGYGHGSREDWGQEIIKYLQKRRQLRQAFVLLNPKHGIKTGDEQLLELLWSLQIPFHVVACKIDEVKPSQWTAHLTALRDQVRHRAQQQPTTRSGVVDVLAVGNLGDGRDNKKVQHVKMVGVDEVRWAVLRSCGLDSLAETTYKEFQLDLVKRIPSVRSMAPKAVSHG